MTPEFSPKIKPKLQARLMEQVATVLMPGEEVRWASTCNNLKPTANHLFVTNYRILGWATGGVLSFEADLGDGFAFEAVADKQTLDVAHGDAEMKFKNIPKPDFPRLTEHLERATAAADTSTIANARSNASHSSAGASGQLRAKRREWDETKVVGKLSTKASTAVARLCHGNEQPWLILTSSGGAGVLAAWEDRLAIIKTGGLTSMMAGSLGGERSAVFHYVDITGVEYNSGFVKGVLEVLTPSYSGGAQKDFWRGSNASRNADSNDPWTLSNTLPLTKAEYNAARDEMQTLRSRIAEAKRPTVQVSPLVAPTSVGTGLADEVKKLADLRDAGILTEEEFDAAKRRLIEG